MTLDMMTYVILPSNVYQMIQILMVVNENIIEHIFIITTEISIFPDSVKREIQTVQFNLFTNKFKLAPVLHMSQLVINLD